MTRDSRRSAFYDAERMIHAMMDRPGGRAHTVELGGTTLTVPAEGRFASVASVQSYVDEVLAHAGVAERFERAGVPVAVRRRRSARAAHYTREIAEIAVPEGGDGRWAMRELVVLHELAHHLDDSTGPAHGTAFAHTLIDLVGLVLGPETGLVYRVVLGDSGLA